MVAVGFKTAPPPQQDDGKAIFARAKRRHYEWLLVGPFPGAAWFRQQALEADPLVPLEAPGGRLDNGRRRTTNLEQTFDLFSGDRALEENLQLDRPMAPGTSGTRAGRGDGQDREPQGDHCGRDGLVGPRSRDGPRRSIPWRRAFPPTSTPCSFPA